jgi:hypothetical protein
MRYGAPVIVMLALGAGGCVLGPLDGEAWPTTSEQLSNQVAVWVLDGTQASPYKYHVQCWWPEIQQWISLAQLVKSGKTDVRDNMKFHEMVVNSGAFYHSVPFFCWKPNGPPDGNYAYYTKLRVARLPVGGSDTWPLYHFGQDFLSCSASVGYAVAATIDQCSVGGWITVHAHNW